LQIRQNGEEINTILIQMSIAFAMLIAGIARYIVSERLSGLKHLQVISGMQLKAYWAGCFFFDIIKMLFTVLVAIILFEAFSLDLRNMMVPLVLLPLGVLPFTYVIAFIF
jgi:ATP-binding cassette subfamily A (ABC1) protein 3